MKAKAILQLITDAIKDAEADGNPDPDVAILHNDDWIHLWEPFEDEDGATWYPVAYSRGSRDLVLIDTEQF